jgi:hypothetical protein
MEYIVPGICGLLVILGLVAIIMSRSNWRIPQMILVIFVLIGSLVFFFFAARTLRTRDNWQAEIRDFEKKIKAVRNGDPSAGEAAQKGIAQLVVDRDQLKQQLAEAMAERGRVWPGANKEPLNSPTGEIRASFDQPPAGLEPKSVVFVFEQSEDEKGKRGQYLGEFTVAQVAGKQVKLAPSSALVTSELNIIGRSKGPWVLYEIMPVDSRSLFAERFEADSNAAKTLLPSSSRDEYVRDQKPAKYDLEKEPKDQPEGNDPVARVRVLVKFTKAWPAAAAAPAAPAAPVVAGGNPVNVTKPPDSKSFRPGDIAYLDVPTAKQLRKDGVAEYENSDAAKFLVYYRPLRDYARLFREAYRERNALFAEKAEISAQAQQVESALAQMKDDIKSAGTQKEGLAKDLAKFKAELASVVAFNQSLDAQFSKTRATLSELFKANLRLSSQLADIEKKLYDAIRSKSPPAEVSASLRR